MSDMPETAISRAVRADAEAARAEIRAEGIHCPSCGVNMADLPRGHRLAVSVDHGSEGRAVLLLGQTAKCATGVPIQWWPASYELAQAATTVMFWDDYNARIDREWDRMIGTGNGEHLTGFLGIVETMT